MTHLSIIMPIYNERATVRRAIESVLAIDFPCSVELIVVDDGSTDGSRDIIGEFSGRAVTALFHPTNMGKGAAVRTGVDRANGSHVIILDADLEYSPFDIAAMVVPVLEGHTNHVFGSRIFGLNTSFQSFKFAVGGRFTTLVANMLFDSWVTDMHTCLKLLPLSDFKTLQLLEDGFGLDTQLTARLLRAGVRPFEVPISYRGRSAAEGKKITWADGVQCLFILARVRLGRRLTLPSSQWTEALLPRERLSVKSTGSPAVTVLTVPESDRTDPNTGATTVTKVPASASA